MQALALPTAALDAALAYAGVVTAALIVTGITALCGYPED